MKNQKILVMLFVSADMEDDEEVMVDLEGSMGDEHEDLVNETFSPDTTHLVLGQHVRPTFFLLIIFESKYIYFSLLIIFGCRLIILN